jgi:hypothetical protein
MSIVKETASGEHFLEKIKTEADDPNISGLQMYQKNLGSDGASGNTVFTLNNPYSPGSGTLFVFLNGQKCTNEVVATTANEYEETDPYTVTFGASLLAFDVVEFIVIGAYPLDADEAAEILGIVTGTKMYFYQAAAPVGWTIDTTLGDAVLAVHGSSSYAGSGSGGVQAGTWTQPGHTHTVDIWANDKTGVILTEGSTSRDRFYDSDNPDAEWTSHSVSSAAAVGKRETSTSDATVSTWRPFANVGIIATKD